jgi:hypothetical protein
MVGSELIGEMSGQNAEMLGYLRVLYMYWSQLASGGKSDVATRWKHIIHNSGSEIYTWVRIPKPAYLPLIDVYRSLLKDVSHALDSLSELHAFFLIRSGDPPSVFLGSRRVLAAPRSTSH